jgi:hypothetical protein
MREETLVVGSRHMGLAALKACLELTLEAPLIPVREPHNPFDANAVKLLSLYGAPVGYVQRAVAPQVAAAMDAGEVVFAKVVRAPNLRAGRVRRMRLRYPRALLWSEPPASRDADEETSMTPGAWEEEDAVEMEKERILEKVK